MIFSIFGSLCALLWLSWCDCRWPHILTCLNFPALFFCQCYILQTAEFANNANSWICNYDTLSNYVNQYVFKNRLKKLNKIQIFHINCEKNLCHNVRIRRIGWMNGNITGVELFFENNTLSVLVSNCRNILITVIFNELYYKKWAQILTFESQAIQTFLWPFS